MSLNHLEVFDYLLAKPEAQLTYPFGDDVKVFKVKNKMFATLSLGKMGKGDDKQTWWMNLKCDPEEALMLRDIFPAIIPGYHMNKCIVTSIYKPKAFNRLHVFL